MALPDLNWYYVGTATFGYNPTVSSALDAVWRLGTSPLYADGGVRTPGVGSAWVWNKEPLGTDTVSTYAVPPINPLSMSYILGGSNAAVAPGSVASNILTPDTVYGQNVIVYGMNRSSGLFAGWAAPNPFTTANSFSKYWRATLAFGAGAYSSISMWESQEAVVIQFNGVTGDASAVAMGALFDPLSYQTGVSCETDGRLYYMFGTGSVGAMTNTWLSDTAATDEQLLGNSSITANQYHGGYFLPGTNTIATTARFGNFSPTQLTTSLDGKLPLIPYDIQASSSTNFLGQSRNFYIVRDWQSGTEPRAGAVRSGTIMSAGWYSWRDAVLFSRG